MDAQIMKLDDAYSCADELTNDIGTCYNKISEDLETIVNNVKNHWKGTDASNHVNALIDEYDKYTDYFSELSYVTSYVSNYFVALQRSRARVSDNSRVGTAGMVKCDSKALSRMDTTDEYFYDGQLKQDYNDICNLCDYYNKFVRNVESKSDTIMNNWKEGKGREQVHQYFSAFNVVSSKMISRLEDLKEEIGNVIANEDHISE